MLDVNETFARDGRGGAELAVDRPDQLPTRSAFSRSTRGRRRRVGDASMCIDADNPTSIVSAVRDARENARTLRPLISTEMWVQLNVFYNRLQELTRRTELRPATCRALLHRRSRRPARPIPASPRARSSATRAGTSTSSAAISSAPTRRRACSMSASAAPWRATRSVHPARGRPLGQAAALGGAATRRSAGSITRGMVPARQVRRVPLYDGEFPRSVRLCIGEIDGAAGHGPARRQRAHGLRGEPGRGRRLMAGGLHRMTGSADRRAMRFGELDRGSRARRVRPSRERLIARPTR